MSIIRELAENYDLDGMELDFCRLAPHLPINRQWEMRDCQTEFVRAARELLLEIAQRRNRPLLLAVRVPDSVEGAKLDGMDLETWAQDQLVDIFMPGPRAIEIDLTGFRRITQGTHIKIYPTLDGFHSADVHQMKKWYSYLVYRQKRIFNINML